jgi:hypothetical protein
LIAPICTEKSPQKWKEKLNFPTWSFLIHQGALKFLVECLLSLNLVKVLDWLDIPVAVNQPYLAFL